MQIPLVMLGAVLVLTGPDARRTTKTAANSVKLAQCLVSLIQHGEAEVPAEEPGVLIELNAREGQQVAVDELLARIDDVRALMQQKVAGLELQVAKAEAENDINVRYAVASQQVAEAEYEEVREANRKAPRAVPQVKVRTLLLAERRAALQIEQARLDLLVAGLKANVKQAEVEAAADNVERRHIRAPLDGIVVKVYPHKGEWVQPGDPVLRIVRVDRLRIEGFLDAASFSPAEVDGRPVTVIVQLPHRSKPTTFQGEVVFVSPLVQAGGQFRVWAEVDNRKEQDHWLLRPGLEVEMNIHLK